MYWESAWKICSKSIGTLVVPLSSAVFNVLTAAPGAGGDGFALGEGDGGSFLGVLALPVALLPIRLLV